MIWSAASRVLSFCMSLQAVDHRATNCRASQGLSLRFDPPFAALSFTILETENATIRSPNIMGTQSGGGKINLYMPYPRIMAPPAKLSHCVDRFMILPLRPPYGTPCHRPPRTAHYTVICFTQHTTCMSHWETVFCKNLFGSARMFRFRRIKIIDILGNKSLLRGKRACSSVG